MENIIIDSKVAPEVFLKVIRAKKSLSSGRAKTVGEAIKEADLSRSAFYKYKDYVFAYDEKNLEHIYTLFFTLEDIAGVLSDILSVLAQNGCNVLTINQNIPIHDIANITISFRHNGEGDITSIIDCLGKLGGIIKIEILAME